MTGMKRIEILRPWAIFVWLFVWQAGVLVLDQQILLVSPVRVLLRLVELAVELDFWKAVAFSTLRITAGFLLGTMAGTMLAGVSARQRILEELLAPFMLAVKSIPVASFIILALILFSSRNLSVLISVLYSGILGGLRAMDKQMLEMVQLFRIPTFRRIRYVYLPQILPYFQTACSSALGLCWKSGIAAEVIGMPTGSIGEQLQLAKVYLDTLDLFAWTLVIVLISLFFERSFLMLLKRAARYLERM